MNALTFTHLIDTDRVDHDAKVVYTSPRPGAPPVYTGYWTEEDWAKWDRAIGRVSRLIEEVEAAGYRVVAL